MSKLIKKAIRRNSVVILKTGAFYGRVIRVLEDGRIFWLCCGYHFHISKPEDLDVGYKGSMKYRGCNRDQLAFIHMTTLRRLKIRASRFHYEYAHNTPLDYWAIKNHVDEILESNS